MASPPLPPTSDWPAGSGRPSSGAGGKILLGCGLGCLLLVILIGGAGGYAFLKLKRLSEEMEQSFARMEEANERHRAAREQLAALDDLHPPRLAEDLRVAMPSEADVDRYLAVHAALEQAIDEWTATGERVRAFGERLESLDGREEPTWAEMKELFSGMTDAIDAGFTSAVARAELFERAVPVLREQEIGPTGLRRLCALVDWGFLRREEGFEMLALSPGDARRLEGARATVAAWEGTDFDDGTWVEDEKQGLRQNVEEARATVAELEARIAAASEISAAARRVLEGRRAELAAIPDLRARALVELTLEPDDTEWMEEIEPE